MTLNTAHLRDPMGSDRSVANTTTPVIVIDGDGGLSVYDCLLDGQPLGRFPSDGFAKVAVQCPPLANGSHILTFTEVQPKPGGPPGFPCVPFAFSVDTVAPPAPTIASVYVDPATHMLRVRGTALPKSAVVLYASVTGLGGALSLADGSWYVATTQLRDGTYTLTASQMDAAGNFSPRSAPVTVVIGTPPPAPTATVPGAPNIDVYANSLAVQILAGTPDGGSIITGYQVWRGTGGPKVLIDTTVNADRYYLDADPPYGDVFYQVAAVNAVGVGPLSAEAAARYDS